MGLHATAKGLISDYDCGYIQYGSFIMRLIREAYGDELYQIYFNGFIGGRAFSQREQRIWNDKCNDDLDLLFFHSDCDGKFTPKECRHIYNAIKDLHMDMIGHNYGDMEPYNMLDRWKSMFKHCADRKVTLFYR